MMSENIRHMQQQDGITISPNFLRARPELLDDEIRLFFLLSEK